VDFPSVVSCFQQVIPRSGTLSSYIPVTAIHTVLYAIHSRFTDLDVVTATVCHSYIQLYTVHVMSFRDVSYNGGAGSAIGD